MTGVVLETSRRAMRVAWAWNDHNGDRVEESRRVRVPLAKPMASTCCVHDSAVTSEPNAKSCKAPLTMGTTARPLIVATASWSPLGDHERALMGRVGKEMLRCSPVLLYTWTESEALKKRANTLSRGDICAEIIDDGKLKLATVWREEALTSRMRDSEPNINVRPEGENETNVAVNPTLKEEGAAMEDKFQILAKEEESAATSVLFLIDKLWTIPDCPDSIETSLTFAIFVTPTVPS